MTRPFKLPPNAADHVLQPYDPREGMTTATAAKMGGLSHAHTRRLCNEYVLSRRVGGGNHRVSRVAWRLFLANDALGLWHYHIGNRAHPSVAREFAKLGIIVAPSQRLLSTTAA